MTVEGNGGTGHNFDRVSCVTPKRIGEPAVSSNIKVVVRVRPENRMEREGGYGIALQVLDERMLVFDPNQNDVPDFYQGKQRRTRDLTKRKHKDIRFVFDRVFDENITQQEVYENTTRSILDGVLDGYNCSVFAYGATGAGKTFTMKGSRDSPGIMFHTMMELYRRIDALKEEKTCDVAISYLEVYNEQIRDLLHPGAYLPVREDPSRGIIVTGLSLHKPRDARDLLHMLEFGNENRTQHPTDANAESSRSHAVFQVFVRQRERTAGMQTDVRVAKMSLIDLAGSERATVTKNRGQRFREGANINRSLLALGNCINALAEGKGKGFIPYRNSKLTRLLKDSLGGNCRTVMIAAISPSYMTFDDTHNTLKYANRAKNIKANLKRNVLSVDFHITRYAKIVDELRTEVTELKAKLQTYESGEAVPQQCEALANFPHQLEIERLQQTLYSVFYDRLSVRSELGELEGLERDLLYRMCMKRGTLARLQVVSSTHEALPGIERQINGMEKRKRKVTSRKASLHARMSENVRELQRVEEDVKALGPDNPVPEVLELSIRTHHLEVELRDTKRHVKHLKKLCRRQERHAVATEKLLQNILAAYIHQQHILKGSGICTNDLSQTYSQILSQIEGGGREVAWADQSVHEGGCDVTVHEAGNAGGEALAPDFDALLDFPVLSCVKTTPKTPRSGHGRTPRRRHSSGQGAPSPRTPAAHCSPINPHTPVSDTQSTSLAARHHTPRALQVTPCAKMSGSFQLLDNSKSMTSYLTPCKQSSAAQNNASVNNFDTNNRLSIDGDSECFNSQTVTIAPARNNVSASGLQLPVVDDSCAAKVVQKSVPCAMQIKCSVCGALNTNSTSIAGSIGGNCRKNFRCKDCNEKNSIVNHKTLNDTFNVIDGIEPLGPSPPPQVHVSKLFSQSEITTQQSSKFSQSHGLKPVQSHSSSQSVLTELQNVASSSSVFQESQTVKQTEKPRGILRGTVTKSKPTPTDENAHPNGSNVARCMDFNDIPKASPAGKLTFAEVVKSPASMPRKLSRSPLTSRENLPPFPQHLFETNTRRTTFAANELDHMAPKSTAEIRRQTMCVEVSGPQRAERTLQSNLKKLGLPSVQEVTHARRVPNYMRPTTSFKNRNHSSSSSRRSNEENHAPGSGHQARRVMIDTATVTKKPARVLQRSKSAASGLHNARRGMYF